MKINFANNRILQKTIFLILTSIVFSSCSSDWGYSEANLDKFSPMFAKYELLMIETTRCDIQLDELTLQLKQAELAGDINLQDKLKLELGSVAVVKDGYIKENEILDITGQYPKLANRIEIYGDLCIEITRLSHKISILEIELENTQDAEIIKEHSNLLIEKEEVQKEKDNTKSRINYYIVKGKW